ncbi:hypothetical protein DVH24_006684 [Malus domestica]|uniref:Uncharacterized protein n=1 Tax=Malus domestica TaxID=3750 RepID=A0A498KDK4_MALDO|nr:hypothetical protein DVH24_006684 [Malus domestica]
MFNPIGTIGGKPHLSTFSGSRKDYNCKTSLVNRRINHCLQASSPRLHQTRPPHSGRARPQLPSHLTTDATTMWSRQLEEG